MCRSSLLPALQQAKRKTKKPPSLTAGGFWEFGLAKLHANFAFPHQRCWKAKKIEKVDCGNHTHGYYHKNRWLTSHKSQVTSHKSQVTSHKSPLPITRHLSLVTCH